VISFSPHCSGRPLQSKQRHRPIERSATGGPGGHRGKRRRSQSGLQAPMPPVTGQVRVPGCPALPHKHVGVGSRAQAAPQARGRQACAGQRIVWGGFQRRGAPRPGPVLCCHACP
jgi:hypothetical protein